MKLLICLATAAALLAQTPLASLDGAKVDVHTNLLVPISCSSFAAWGSKTRDGNLLIGRNMDYPLNNYYEVRP